MVSFGAINFKYMDGVMSGGIGIMNIDIDKVDQIMRSESLIKAAEAKIGTIL